MSNRERNEVRRTLRSIYGTWHRCALRKPERGMKAGRLCDVCLDCIAADMKRILEAGR